MSPMIIMDTENSTCNVTCNQTSNGTNENVRPPVFLKWVSLFILLGIVIFNIVVIVLLLRRKKKSRMGFFVANLAISDLSVGLCYVLPHLVFTWFSVQWIKYACYLWFAYFSLVSLYVSTYAILVLTIDRAFVIVRPLSASAKGPRYRFGLALSAWVIGLLLGIQYVIYIKYEEPDTAVYCWHDLPHKEAILYFDLFAFVIIPVAIMVTCYTLIIYTIYKREKNGLFRTEKSDSDALNNSRRGYHVIKKAKIKTAKLLVVVVLVYIICWTPITVAAVVSHYSIIEWGPWFQVLFVFAPMSSFANPLVFLIFNRKMFFPKTKNSKTLVTTMKIHTESELLRLSRSGRSSHDHFRSIRR